MIMESSYGRVRFDRARSAVLTVNLDVTAASYNSRSEITCPHFDLSTMAKDAAAALATPIHWEDYDHRIFYIPTELQGCGFGGMANICCTPTFCNVWMRSKTIRVLAHEIGHNLCLKHAQTDTNNDGVKEQEYGDQSAIMGYGSGGFNAPARILRGWMSDKQVYAFGDEFAAENQGNCTGKNSTDPYVKIVQIRALAMAPTADDSSFTHVITIPRSDALAHAGGGLANGQVKYYISYRGAVDGSYDKDLIGVASPSLFASGQSSPGFQQSKNRVHIKYQNGPATNAEHVAVLSDPTDAPWTDPASGIVIELVSKTCDYNDDLGIGMQDQSNCATVQISLCSFGEFVPPPEPVFLCDSDDKTCCDDVEDTTCTAIANGGRCGSSAGPHCKFSCGLCGESSECTLENGSVVQHGFTAVVETKIDGVCEHVACIEGTLARRPHECPDQYNCTLPAADLTDAGVGWCCEQREFSEMPYCRRDKPCWLDSTTSVPHKWTGKRGGDGDDWCITCMCYDGKLSCRGTAGGDVSNLQTGNRIECPRFDCSFKADDHNPMSPSVREQWCCRNENKWCPQYGCSLKDAVINKYGDPCNDGQLATCTTDTNGDDVVEHQARWKVDCNACHCDKTQVSCTEMDCGDPPDPCDKIPTSNWQQTTYNNYLGNDDGLVDHFDLSCDSCNTTEGAVVPHGWTGPGEGADSCNTCWCHNGAYACTKKDCPPFDCRDLSDALEDADKRKYCCAQVNSCNPKYDPEWPWDARHNELRRRECLDSVCSVSRNQCRWDNVSSTCGGCSTLKPQDTGVIISNGAVGSIRPTAGISKGDTGEFELELEARPPFDFNPWEKLCKVCEVTVAGDGPAQTALVISVPHGWKGEDVKCNPCNCQHGELFCRQGQGCEEALFCELTNKKSVKVGWSGMDGDSKCKCILGSDGVPKLVCKARQQCELAGGDFAGHGAVNFPNTGDRWCEQCKVCLDGILYGCNEPNAELCCKPGDPDCNNNDDVMCTDGDNEYAVGWEGFISDGDDGRQFCICTEVTPSSTCADLECPDRCEACVMVGDSNSLRGPRPACMPTPCAPPTMPEPGSTCRDGTPPFVHMIKHCGLEVERVRCTCTGKTWDCAKVDLQPCVFCTEDVHECPDGTMLSRDPALDCGFPACPRICEKDSQKCLDGTMLSRDPTLDCEFPDCSGMCMSSDADVPNPKCKSFLNEDTCEKPTCTWIQTAVTKAPGRERSARETVPQGILKCKSPEKPCRLDDGEVVHPGWYGLNTGAQSFCHKCMCQPTGELECKNNDMVCKNSCCPADTKPAELDCGRSGCHCCGGLATTAAWFLGNSGPTLEPEAACDQAGGLFPREQCATGCHVENSCEQPPYPNDGIGREMNRVECETRTKCSVTQDACIWDDSTLTCGGCSTDPVAFESNSLNLGIVRRRPVDIDQRCCTLRCDRAKGFVCRLHENDGGGIGNAGIGEKCVWDPCAGQSFGKPCSICNPSFSVQMVIDAKFRDNCHEDPGAIKRSCNEHGECAMSGDMDMFLTNDCEWDKDQPVCGDRQTYQSKCHAKWYGAVVITDGECKNYCTAECNDCQLENGEFLGHGESGFNTGKEWCNTCQCFDGQLTCTRMQCEVQYDCNDFNQHVDDFGAVSFDEREAKRKYCCENSDPRLSLKWCLPCKSDFDGMWVTHGTSPVFFRDDVYDGCVQCKQCNDGKLQGCYSDASHCQPDCEPEATCKTKSCSDLASWTCKEWCDCSSRDHSHLQDTCGQEFERIASLQKECRGRCRTNEVGKPEKPFAVAIGAQLPKSTAFCCAKNPALRCLPCELPSDGGIYGKLVEDGWTGSTTRCNKCMCTNGMLKCKTNIDCSEDDFDCSDALAIVSEVQKSWCCKHKRVGCGTCTLPHTNVLVKDGWRGPKPTAAGEIMDAILPDGWCIFGTCQDGELTWTRVESDECPTVDCKRLGAYESAQEGPCRTRDGCEQAKRYCCKVTEGEMGCKHCQLPWGRVLLHDHTTFGTGDNYCNKYTCTHGKLSYTKQLCVCRDFPIVCDKVDTDVLCAMDDVREDKLSTHADLGTKPATPDPFNLDDPRNVQQLCPVTCKICNPERDDVVDCKSLFFAVNAGKDVQITEGQRAHCCRTTGTLGCKSCQIPRGGVGGNYGDDIGIFEYTFGDDSDSEYCTDDDSGYNSGQIVGHKEEYMPEDGCNICSCSDGTLRCTADDCNELGDLMRYAETEAAGLPDADHTILWANDRETSSFSITVTAGDVVVWDWSDALSHTVTFTDGLVSSQNSNVPVSGIDHYHTITFDGVGVFAYSCILHGGMTGIITVEAADACENDLAISESLVDELGLNVTACEAKVTELEANGGGGGGSCRRGVRHRHP